VQVRRGDALDSESDVAAFVACLLPGVDDLTTTADFDRKTIATQCCDSNGGCFRRFDDDNSKCVAGYSIEASGSPYITPHTYAEALSICSSLELRLCEKSCKGKGCSYNLHPVYTSLPCPLPPP
jgi:hypothetical protein